MLPTVSMACFGTTWQWFSGPANITLVDKVAAGATAFKANKLPQILAALVREEFMTAAVAATKKAPLQVGFGSSPLHFCSVFAHF